MDRSRCKGSNDSAACFSTPFAVSRCRLCAAVFVILAQSCKHSEALPATSPLNFVQYRKQNKTKKLPTNLVCNKILLHSMKL